MVQPSGPLPSQPPPKYKGTLSEEPQEAKQLRNSDGSPTWRVHYKDLDAVLPVGSHTLYDLEFSKVAPDSFLGGLMQLTGHWAILRVDEIREVLVNVNDIAKRLNIRQPVINHAIDSSNGDVTNLVNSVIKGIVNQKNIDYKRLNMGLTHDEIQVIDKIILDYPGKGNPIFATPWKDNRQFTVQKEGERFQIRLMNKLGGDVVQFYWDMNG